MKKIIAFSKFNKYGLLLSLVVTASLLAFTFVKGGFNLGIDFQSGQTIDIRVEGTNVSELAIVLEEEFDLVVVTQIGNNDADLYNIKLAYSEENQEENVNKVQDILEKNVGELTIESTSFIGSGISQNLFQSVTVLVLGALSLILVYIWFRFKLQFAIAALFSLLHDILFIVGVVGAFQIEVSVATVAAILTIIGYSLNDTIVIFDRIRENIVFVREGSFHHIADKSITQTLSRTIITSFTTLLAVLALLIFARGDVYNFARVLLIGVLEGTWSSLFIAAPVLSLFNHKKILDLFRRKQGSGIQYKESSDVSSGEGAVSTTTQGTSIASHNVSSNDIERVRQAVRERQKHKKNKKR